MTIDELTTLSGLLQKYYDELKSKRTAVLDNETTSTEYKCIRYSVIMEDMKKVSHVKREIDESTEEMQEKLLKEILQ